MKTRIQETCFPIWCLWSFWYINVAFFLAIFAWGRRILPYWRQYRSITCVFSYIYAYFVVQGEGKGIRRTSALCEKLFWLIYWPLQWNSWGADTSCYLCCGGLHVWCRAGQTFESSSIISLTDYPQLLSLNPPHSTCAYHPVFLHNLIIMIFWGSNSVFFCKTKVLGTEEEYFTGVFPYHPLCSWGFPKIIQQAEPYKPLLVGCLHRPFFFSAAPHSLCLGGSVSNLFFSSPLVPS